MVKIRHQLPGRLRLGVPALRKEPQLTEPLLAALRRHPGVRQVRANPACASLVVSFVPGTFDPALAEQSLRDLRAADSARSVGDATPAAIAIPLLGRLRRLSARWLGRHETRHRRQTKQRRPGLLLASARRRAERDRRAAPPCRFCRVQQRITRWMVRRQLRCWWQGRSQAAGRPGRWTQPQQA
jgi:hypothetical protein